MVFCERFFFKTLFKSQVEYLYDFRNGVIQKLVCFFFLILTQTNALSAQTKELSFTNIPLNEAIQTIEKQSDYIFNYDPDLLSASSFSGKLDLSNLQKCFTQLLYDSPLEFELDANTVIIYQADPSNFYICGTVQDAQSKTPLLFASVFANEINLGIQTDENGYFETSVTAYKNQRISFSYIGYQTRSIQLQEWKIGECQTINLQVDEDLWNKEIIITDYLMDGISEGEEYSGYQLNYQQLAKYHSTVEHDILKTAQLLPGITSLNESAASLQIRGGTSDQNLILWEGATIYQSGHLFGMISAINPFSVHEINIFKGVYDPKYDNRVGGIIDVSLSDSIQTTVHGSAGMSLTEGHLNLETPIIANKLAVLFSGRHSINVLFDSPALQRYENRVFQFSKIDDFSEDAEEGLVNTEQSLNFYDWNAKILYRPTDRLFLKAGIYQNRQSFQYDLSFPDDPAQTSDQIVVNSEAVHSNLDWAISKKWTSSLSFIRSKYVNEFAFIEEENNQRLKKCTQFNDIVDQSLTFSHTYTYSPVLTFNAGYDYNSKQVNYNFINELGFGIIDEDINFESGRFHNLFVSSKFRKAKYNLDVGSRLTFYQEKKRWVFSPRFSFQYAFNKKWKLKTEGGIFHQFVSQLRDFGSPDIVADNPLWILNTDETELSQKSSKFATGLIYQNKGFLIDIEGYYNRVDGLSSLSPFFDLLEESAFTRGQSTAIGLDILVKKRWTDFNTWVNYSLGKITYFFPAIVETPFLAPNDIRHNLSLVSSYTFKELQLSLTNSFHSGLPFTSPVELFDFYDEEDETTIYSIIFSDPNNDRLKPYFRTDFTLNYRPNFKRAKKIKTEVALSILNIFNRKNIFARKYSLDLEASDPPNIGYVESALLQTTPLVLVRVHW